MKKISGEKERSLKQRNGKSGPITKKKKKKRTFMLVAHTFRSAKFEVLLAVRLGCKSGWMYVMLSGWSGLSNDCK